MTINGSNFAGVTNVLFGAKAATAVVVSAGGTEITCKSPSHVKGAVDVTVVTPVGTSDPVSDLYEDVPVGLHLQVVGISNPTTAGATSTVTVTALDGADHVWTGYVGTIHFTSTDSSATLPPDFAFKLSDAGVHTFTGGVTLKKAGLQTVTATDKADLSVTGFQTVTVAAGSATHLIVSGIADPAIVSRATTVTVTAADAFENTAPSYRGTIKFTSTDTSATLPSTFTFTAPDNGVQSFPNGVIFKKIGNQTVTATDETTSTVKGAQTVAVITDPTTHFRLTGIANPVQAGVLSSLTVTALDAQDHTVPAYRGSIHFTSTDASATLPVDYTFSAADNGVHAFSGGVTLKKAGSQTVTATDKLLSSIAGSQIVTVTAGSTTHLNVTGIANPFTAGNPSNFSVTAADAYDNADINYRGHVLFTSTDASATFSPDNYTFTAPDQGVHLFVDGVTLKKMGSRTVIATDAGTSSINGSQTVTVIPAALDRFVFGPISTETSGTAFAITITAKDAFDNTKTNFNDTAHLEDSTDTIDPDSAPFVSGLFSGMVTIFEAQDDATITASFGGVTSASNAFDVNQ